MRRLGFLRELVPTAKRISVLLDPANAMDVAAIVRELNAAAGRTSGLQIKIVNASTGREIDAAFAGFGRERPDALLLGPSRPTGGCNWRCWRRFTIFPRRIPGATLSMPAG